MKIPNKPADRFDWTLAFILLLFFLVSLFAIASAQTTGQYTINFVPSQIQWYFIGCVIIAITMFLEPDQYKKAAWIIYGGGVFILALLFILPESMDLVSRRNGAKSWFHLPGIGSIQPAEFMKTFFIIGMARMITMHHEKFDKKTLKTDFFLLGKIIAVLFLPFLFIMMQTDLGTGLVFIAITAAFIVVAGITWRIILPVFAGTATIGATIAVDGTLRAGFSSEQNGF